MSEPLELTPSMIIHPVFRRGVAHVRALCLLILSLYLGANVSHAGVTTVGDSFIAEHGKFYIELSTTGTEMVRFGYREDPGSDWQVYDINLTGVEDNTSLLTKDVPPTVISYTELGDHLIVKYSVRNAGLYWTFWFDLEEGAGYLKTYRFIYCEEQRQQQNGVGFPINGVGILMNAPGYTSSTGEQEYTVDGVDFTGGWADFQKDQQGLRVMVDNMYAQEWNRVSDGQVLWYRHSTRGSIDFGTRIDYKRLVFVPYQVGQSPTEYDRFMREHVFDHPLTNVERVSGWIVRSKRANGAVRDWFNETYNWNGFVHGTGTYKPGMTGYWADDWSTGGILRQLRDTYNVTGDPFYFMRLVDMADYQIDRDAERVKYQWEIGTVGMPNYPMGRVEGVLEVGAISGWSTYQQVGSNSTEWFFQVLDPSDYLNEFGIKGCDFCYGVIGLYMGNKVENLGLQSTIDQYYEFIEDESWNPQTKLYVNTGAQQGNPWCRGIGWWIETFSETMPFYQGNRRDEFHQRFVDCSNEVVKLQHEGAWHRYVDDPTSILDSSGTLMIASGFANSFMLGDLSEVHLNSAMEAIKYAMEHWLEPDGTIIGTDRQNVFALDPFPYTQEGFVKFAAALGIKEIIKLADRDQLYTTLDDGVFIIDDAGGTVTDSHGDALTVSGPIIIRRHAEYGSAQTNLQLLGLGTRTVTVHGLAPNTEYKVIDTNLATGGSVQTLTTGPAGELAVTIDLAGSHRIDIFAPGANSPWAGHETYYDGWLVDPVLGITYVDWAPYIWSERLGWIFVPADQSLWSLWAYSYEDLEWVWMTHEWPGWVYHVKNDSWVNRDQGPL